MSWIETPPVIVILARQFNPSILSPVWLAKNGILNENGDYKPDSVFVGQLTQAVTDEFVLVMVADQLQFLPLVDPEQQPALIEGKVGKIIKKLPHIKF